MSMKIMACAPVHTAIPSYSSGMEEHTQPVDDRRASVERSLLDTVEAAEKLGPANPLLLSSLHSLAGFYRNQGQYAKAEELYRRCLAIKEEVSGLNHPDVATILEQYAGLLKEAKRANEARVLERRALAIRTIQSQPHSGH